MQKPLHSLLVIALIGGAVALTIGVTATADPDPKARKIGFVDMKKAFARYDQRQVREGELRTLYRAKIKALNGLKDEIEEMKEDTNLYKKGTRARLAKEKELYLLKRRFELRRKLAEEDFDLQLRKMYISLYREIQAAVEVHARTAGYDAIFQVNNDPITGSNEMEMKVEIRTRGVLYYRKSLDLTEDVIRLLNGKKKGGKKGKEGKK